MMGKVSRRITAIQDTHYSEQESKKNGLGWTIELIKKLLDVSWDMWDHRNHIKHNSPHPNFEPQHQNPLNQQIRQEWATGMGSILADERFLFKNNTLPDLLSCSTPEKCTWLESVAVARAASTSLQERTNRSAQGSRELLESWLSQE